jgi:hypothetical protein
MTFPEDVIASQAQFRPREPACRASYKSGWPEQRLSDCCVLRAAFSRSESAIEVMQMSESSNSNQEHDALTFPAMCSTVLPASAHNASLVMIIHS